MITKYDLCLLLRAAPAPIGSQGSCQVVDEKGKVTGSYKAAESRLAKLVARHDELNTALGFKQEPSQPSSTGKEGKGNGIVTHPVAAVSANIPGALKGCLGGSIARPSSQSQRLTASKPAGLALNFPQF